MKYKAIPMLFALSATLFAIEIDIPTYEAELDKIAEQRKIANSELAVERGIAVDIKKKEIVLDAITTEITEKGISEFAIISLNSGHDYEALFKVYATPTAICKAVESLGTKRGRPVDYSSLSFWSKGEHFTITVRYNGVERPLTDYIFNAEKNQIMDPITFIYLGAKWNKSDDGKEVFAGDSEGPGSIVSMYNEPLSVFDIPKSAPQGQAYEKSLVSKNVIGKEGEKVEIIIRPEERPASALPRNNDINLLLTKDGVIINAAEAAISPIDFVKYLNEKKNLKQDTYAQINYSSDVSLTDIASFSTLLDSLEVKELIKVESPKEQIYYKAFLPQDGWLKRSDRLAQPLELHLTKQNDVLTKTLIAIKEIWPDNSESINPILEPKVYDISNPDTIKDVIIQAEAWKRDLTIDDSVFKNFIATGQAPILVFAPVDLTFNELRMQLEPFRATHKNVFVFVGKKILD